MSGALVLAAVAVILQGTLAWYLAWQFRRASIADIFWPLHHLLAALIWLLVIPVTLTTEALLTFTLVSLWAVRLATHLSVRQVGAPEDHRYTALRSGQDANFDQRSLYVIFIPQALMAWFMSLALIPVLSAAQWSWLAYLGLGVAVAGLVWEVIADLQLTAFLKHSQTHQVMNLGLWSLSRHPNYFGEWLFWLGICLSAFSLMETASMAAALPMVLLTYLLLRFTGVKRTEDGMSRRRPDYEAYRQATPGFFPKLPGSRPVNAPDLSALLGTLGASYRHLVQRLGWWSILLCLGVGISADFQRPAYAQLDNQQRWFFDVRIDGKDVGFHEFVASRSASGYEVQARAEFRYKILGVTLFSYEHQVQERYDANMCLLDIQSQTKTNATVQQLTGAAVENGYALTTDEEVLVDQTCLMTFAYWSPTLFSRQQLLNGQTGQVMDVILDQQPVSDTEPTWTQYSLVADKIDITLGFDETGTWRSLVSKLQNGRTLTYHLRSEPTLAGLGPS
jgi:steroid 5-alpha reductase family enzyme